jgi:hypothetical protein
MPISDPILISGKLSTFGGPNDTDVGPRETCALYPKVRCRDLGTGLYTRHYCAMRWDYKATARALACGLSQAIQFIRDQTIYLYLPAKPNEIATWAYPADWGPAASTSRLIDVSPTILAELDLHTDDQVIIELPPEIKLKP